MRSDRGRALRLAATSGGVLAALALPTAATGDESVYVANTFSQGTVSQFAVGPFGPLVPLSPATVTAGDAPFSIAIGPDGRSAYVSATSGGSASNARVWQFDIAPAGTLAPKTPASVDNGRFPRGIAIAPNGASVYTAEGAGTVGQYDVGVGGALTPKTPGSVAAGAAPQSVAVSPDGRSVYVVNQPPGTPLPAGTVSQYDVDAAGRLTPKSPPTVPTGDGPSGIAVSPDGRSVYVANRDSDTVSQFDVGPGGGLAPKSPATVATGGAPNGVAVSPDGRSVYVANFVQSVSQYVVGPSGALTPMSPASVATGGNGVPVDLVVSPDSRRVYVTIPSGPVNLNQFHAGVGGALYPMSPDAVPATNAARGIAIRPRTAPVAAASAGTSGLLAALDGSASRSPEGSIARYDWDFGDGRVLSDGGATPAHLYAAAGSYQVTLTVTDDAGCSTALVFTGRMASCNGGPTARTTIPVTVSAPAQGGPTGGVRDRLAIALAARRYRATARRRVRVAFATTLAGRATLQALRGRRVVARSSRRVGRGPGTLALRVRRPGRYRLRLVIRSADGQRVSASARLVVRQRVAM
ncbi:MAG TPA: PKD domain-containing protein [Solirubrobacteraceae bacterium]|nr:PKD domain-containing protein [Solirubrobacteraceae bacterium]